MIFDGVCFDYVYDHSWCIPCTIVCTVAFLPLSSFSFCSVLASSLTKDRSIVTWHIEYDFRRASRTSFVTLMDLDFGHRQDEDEELTERDIRNLIHLPGFSLLAPPPIVDDARQGIIEGLPTLNENDLANLNEKDSNCPICYNTFLAILAEEEMASVMDSPAAPSWMLGVTRLADTCGHVFCRKDISEWLRDNNNCPTCRRVVIAEPTNEEDGEEQEGQEGPNGMFLFDMGGVRIYAQDIVPTTLPAGRNATSDGSPPFQSSERDGHDNRDDEGRTHEYSRLFS